SQGRHMFDRGGDLALLGHASPRLLARLLQHPYFRRPAPKSAGREQFGSAYVAAIRRHARGISAPSQMATLVELTAHTVARGLRRGGAAAERAEVIVSGGGVHNQALMAALAAALPRCTWRRSDELGVPSQAKEAIAFAFLGEAHLRGEPANLPRVTGARRAVVLGSYTPAPY
ncbi:MAG: anhydro-N-acetylmuramic acid kinase, partial [Terriglobales bacterium]